MAGDGYGLPRWILGEQNKRKNNTNHQSLPFIELRLSYLTPEGKCKYLLFHNDHHEDLSIDHLRRLVHQIEEEYKVPLEKREEEEWKF